MDSYESTAEYQKRDPFFWAAIGPIFLTVALSALLFQASLVVWPFVALACIGLLLTWGWGNRGFFFSILSLIVLTIWKYPFVHEHLWCSLFLGSMSLSWIMVLLGRKEVRSQGVQDLEKQNERAQECSDHLALQEKYDLLYAHAHEKDHTHIQDLKGLKSALQNALEELNKVQEGAECAKRETQIWVNRCEALTLEVSGFQTREKELESALAEVQSAPQSLLAPANPIVSQESFEEMGEEVPKDLFEMQMKYRQLQGQFQEKTEVLTQSRKEFFNTEGELLLCHKEEQEKIASLCQQDRQFHHHLGALEQECRDLELQVVHLEQIISSLLAPKKPARPRVSKPKKKGTLSSVIKEAMDKKQSPQQISLLDS